MAVRWVAMVTKPGTFKVWAVEFESVDAMLAWSKANPKITIDSYGPLVSAEDAIKYVNS